MESNINCNCNICNDNINVYYDLMAKVHVTQDLETRITNHNNALHTQIQHPQTRERLIEIYEAFTTIREALVELKWGINAKIVELIDLLVSFLTYSTHDNFLTRNPQLITDLTTLRSTIPNHVEYLLNSISFNRDETDALLSNMERPRRQRRQRRQRRNQIVDLNGEGMIQSTDVSENEEDPRIARERANRFAQERRQEEARRQEEEREMAEAKKYFEDPNY